MIKIIIKYKFVINLSEDENEDNLELTTTPFGFVPNIPVDASNYGTYL